MSAEARFICLISAWGEIEKAKHTTRDSHSSNSPLSWGPLVWWSATFPGTKRARRRAARLSVNSESQ